MGKVYRAHLLAATVLGATCATPAFAQAVSEDTASGNDIIVTAQRVEQRLQDVPISITVFDNEKLTNNNISSAKDLVTYTPGLSANSRYGADNTTFAIRGFTQEQRTYSTVGTFFADVVMPRGSGATQGGDGAGPGALFDLQNVQVLKGPQGTLFGRNVTGGAVLLVPQKPKDDFSGYVEGTIGNYDLRRAQAVINVPVMDTLRIRVGVDHQERDGYLKNAGNFGDGRFGNKGMASVDYWAFRFSALMDLTPDLENYLIVNYSHSQANPVFPKVTRCSPGVGQNLGGGSFLPIGNLSCQQIAREAQLGFWSVSNRLPDASSVTRTWQFINTTTWQASDSLTVKNIFSYGEFTGTTNIELFGNYLAVTVPLGTETSPSQIGGFAFVSSEPAYGNANAQASLIDELQFQGQLDDGRFTWQAGLYTEINTPLGFSGIQTAAFTPCIDIATFNCLARTQNRSAGSGQFGISKSTFRDHAVYGQVSYDITEQLKLTAGARYTWDKVKSIIHNENIQFNNPPGEASARVGCLNLTAPGYAGENVFPFPAAQRFAVCQQTLRQSTKAPTWLLGLDWKPIDNLLLYAKWSRGYRQGGIAILGPDPIQAFEAEKVDTYEAGGKLSWRGSVPGYFNISGYYNDFRNQQVPFGVQCNGNIPNYTVACGGSLAILNAGASRMYGFEAEVGITPFEGLRLEAAYGYLKTKLTEVVSPVAGSLPPYNEFFPPIPTICPAGIIECTSIPNSGPRHKLVASATYRLPLPDEWGKLSVGGTYVYQSRMRATVDNVTGSNNGILPSFELINLNLNWENVAGMPFDAGAFVTNVTNEKYFTHVNDNSGSRGFVSHFLGEPRMYGFRLRYKFGQ